MQFIDQSNPPQYKATRSSVACLQCRSRHLKCNGGKPRCTRCIDAATQCHYTQSRRGGLDRAALAERRKRLAANAATTPSDPANSSYSPASALRGPSPTVAPVDEIHTSMTSDFDITSNELDEDLAAIFPKDVASDALIDQFYKSFHEFHPFLLPRKYFIELCQDRSQWPCLEPLVTSMRLMGKIYSSKIWPTTLQMSIETQFKLTSSRSPFMVQSRLLYSIALFWHGFKDESTNEVKAAAKLALDLKMHCKEFAYEHGDGNQVLTESWRRTWWMFFIVDAYYAGTLGTLSFVVIDVESTVELPCEEAEYESGMIPEPRTQEDFDCREFAASEEIFSSFAYLIGAVKCAALATYISRKAGVEEASIQVIQAADSIIDGWLLLMPKGSKQIMSKSGNIDELLFQAYLLVHVAIIGLHRPLSDLKFNAIEGISSCARDVPPDAPISELINVHTVRVIRSAEAQIGLLALPSRPFAHSPFVTCMISEGTLALLSACKFFLKGKELAVARDQIRMTIGCLASLAQIWSRTAKNLEEIKTIARHVFDTESKASQTSTPDFGKIPSLLADSEPISLGSENGSTGTDVFSRDMDNICGWYNLGNADSGAWLDGFLQDQIQPT